MPAASMGTTAYPNADAFLEQSQASLEAGGPAAAFLLGICLRMAHFPERVVTTPRFLAVGDRQGLALAAVLNMPWYLVVHGLHGDLGAPARALASYLLAEGWPVSGVEGQAAAASAVAAHLAEAASRRPCLVRRQILYVLRTVPALPAVDGRLRLATDFDLSLVARWWHGSSLATLGQDDPAQDERSARRHLADGAVYVWDVGRPVSMAVTTGPTRTAVTLARVYTPPEERERGFATACVGALSHLMLTQGHEYCTLFVEPSNSPAQHVYSRVGYRSAAEFHEIALLG